MITTLGLISRNYDLLLLKEPLAQCGIYTALFTIIFILYMLQTIKKQIGSKKRVKQPFEDVPMLPNAHPIFGHIPSETSSAIISEVPSLSIDLLKQYSHRGITSLWYMSHPFLIVFDPKAASSLLQSYSFREVPPIVDKHFSKSIGKKNLLLMNGKEWRLYRGAIHKAMTTSFLKHYQRTMVECSYKLTSSLKQKIKMKQRKTVDVDGTKTKQIHEDIAPIMKMITADVFFQVSIGMDLQSCEKLQTSKLLKCLDVLSKDFLRRLLIHPLRPWNYFYFIPTIHNIKRYFLRLYTRKVVGDHVQKRRSEKTDINNTASFNKKEKNDMLSNILNVEDFDLTKEDILSVVFTLLHAGFETTSTALVYAFYMITTHPDIEKDLIEEIQNVLTTADGKDKMDFDVSKLVLCRAIINETLRMYPIAYQVGRSIAKDDTMEINGLKFHGPAYVRIPTWSIQRDESNFPRPEEFLPERWARRTASSTMASEWMERFPGDDCKEEKEWASKYRVPPANRGAFVAFSTGARDCVGKKFAYQEATIVLAILLKELKFEAEEEYVCVPVKTGFLQSPRDGMPMYISERI